ncbi:MAG TPA: replication-associated recombination protein A, partial [Opitutales bacterium]|nr:replication-associated recombination protein A [Opitutales bacterium]
KRHPILVIDEIHRFNKAQQDVLLPDLESGAVRLIGLTTHHPGHYLIPALLSRSHLFRLEPLTEEVLQGLLEKALTVVKAEAAPEVITRLIAFSDGDARRALNALETLLVAYPGQRITVESFTHFAQERHLAFDRDEDEHYNTASAFIKSMRGGDPDAALYWLAKLLIGGEDPRFVARRLVILASEDVGLADPRALPLAVAAFQACELVGPPECELNLAHVTVFLATCPKSNSAYLGLKAAKAAIAQGPVQQVPVYLRDSSGKTAKKMGYGADYLYSHDFAEAITGQDYMEKPQRFYEPKPVGAEAAIAQRLEGWKALKRGLKK